MTDLDNAAITAGACETLTEYPFGEVSEPCGEPGIALDHSACIHEHFGTCTVCAGCAAEIQHCAGGVTCARCEDGPEPHECLPRVMIAWFDGSPVTIVQEARP